MSFQWVLRADLLDQKGKVIEQYLALSFDVGEKLERLLSPLNAVNLPDALSPSISSTELHWSLGYVPEGFSPLVTSRHRLMNLDRAVETKMYSDGVFSFSVYLMSVDQASVPKQWGKQGRRTIVTTQKGQQEVVVIGDIPVSTAKRIAESVRLSPMENRSS
jgi:sigma-E factor negative regulatory protein RseB